VPVHNREWKLKVQVSDPPDCDGWPSRRRCLEFRRKDSKEVAE